jgi:hypothetical protein
MSILTMEASDRINPIVVKEVRQGLRTRTFVGSFLTLLIVCVLIALYAWAANLAGEGEDGGFTTEGGAIVFMLIFGCLAFVSFFVLPFNAYRSLLAERSEETWSTLILTRLSARQILRGKIASFLIQGLLFASAAGPFLLFSYFLQGVSLAFILISLFLGAVYSSFAILVAVCWATFAPTGVSRQASFFSLLMLLFFGFTQTMTQLALAIRLPSVFLGASAFQGYALSIAMLATAGAVIFELAAGKLSPSNANTAVGPRVALLAHLAVPFVRASLVADGDRGPVLVGLLIYGTLWIYSVGLYGVGGAGAPPAALRARTFIAGLFFPGALRSWRFTVLLLWIWSSLLFLLGLKSAGQFEPTFFIVLPALATIYLGVPAAARALLVRWTASPPNIRVLLLLTIVFLTLVPGAIDIALNSRSLDPVFFIFNPIVLAFEKVRFHGAGTEHMGIVWTQLLAAMAVAVVADSLLRRREAAETVETP